MAATAAAATLVVPRPRAGGVSPGESAPLVTDSDTSVRCSFGRSFDAGTESEAAVGSPTPVRRADGDSIVAWSKCPLPELGSSTDAIGRDGAMGISTPRA
jgi:hypothetical protein